MSFIKETNELFFPFTAGPTINLQPKENEKNGKGKKVRFSVPEEYSAESPDRLINQRSVTSEEVSSIHFFLGWLCNLHFNPTSDLR